MEQPSPERCASLKAHKSLPRRRAVAEELLEEEEILLASKAGQRRSYTSPAKEERITSWIRDSSPPTPTNVSFLMPLTPPEDAMNDRVSIHTERDSVRDVRHGTPSLRVEGALATSMDVASGSATPVNSQPIPPTPDLTPPRKTRQRSPSPPLRRKNRVSLSPPPAPTSRQMSRQTSGQASTRAMSFKTAPEGSPRLTSASVATFHTIRSKGTPSEDRSPRNDPGTVVGLGLGIPGDEDMKTPTVEVPGLLLNKPSPALLPPSSTSGTPKMVRTDPLVAGDIPALKELAHIDSFLSPGEVERDDPLSSPAITYIKDDDTPFKERAFFEDIARHSGDHGLAESDLSSRRSISPLSDESNADPLMTRAQKDSKRFSQVSNLSVPQSVEVVVIDDSSPRRKRKLRHSSKNTSLRAASSSHGGSNRSSLQSSADVKPRLNNTLGRQNFRATASTSLHSDSGISMAGSDHIMRRWSKMQYIEIPRRAPSITRSLPLSSQRYISPRSSQRGSRPSTAPNGGGTSPSRSSRQSSYIKASFPKESILARDYERSRRGRTKVPPAIPTRSSSLSAPTSRDPQPQVAKAPFPPQSTTVAASAPAPVETKKKGAWELPSMKHNRSVSQPIPKPKIVIEPETPEPEPLPQSAREFGSRAPPALTLPPQPLPNEMPRDNALILSPLTTDVKSSLSGSQSPRTPLWMRRSSDASDIRPLPNLTATRNTTPRRSSKDDTALMASRALLKTPFSGMSIQSSASGFMEVHEATAINIYPHTNSSLLVIQQSSDGSMNFPAHPAVRPGAYRIAEVSTPSPSEQMARNESVHVTVNGPDGRPVISHGNLNHVPTRDPDSPLQNPRPAPSPGGVRATDKADDDALLPAVNLIPPTPLDGPLGARASTNKTTLVSGPVSLVKKALTNRRNESGNVPRSSGLWLSSGRGKKSARGSVIKNRKPRTSVGENNLSPFWRPRRFWDDSDHTDSEDEEYHSHHADASNASSSPEQKRGQFYSLGGSSAGREEKVGTKPRSAGNDYFSNMPIRNTLGFPQQRLVVSGPASLVRRLSSIRRRRTAVQTAWADPKLNPSGSPKPPATLPEPGAGSSTNLAAIRTSNPRASPSPSAMSRQSQNRRKKSNAGSRRKVRFEFHPMRGLTGGSGESKEWRTKGMVKRLKETRDKRREDKDREEAERIEKRRRELRGLIGMPRLNGDEIATEI